MNVLLKLRKDMPICGLVPFKYLLYVAMLSNVIPYEDEDTRYGIFPEKYNEIGDFFPDWEHSDIKKDAVVKALDELAEEGLILFDSDNIVYLGEYRGRKFFPFEKKSSLFDDAVKLAAKSIKHYGASKSAKDKSRSRFIKEQFDKLLDKGIPNLTSNDFTELHGYLYEVYTGGEVYIIRNKVELFQTNNMLKAYDKYNVFALITEGTLHYDSYRKKGIPTLTNVACIKDEVFKSLTRTESGSKDYMRELGSEDSDF